MKKYLLIALVIGFSSIVFIEYRAAIGKPVLNPKPTN